MQILLISTDLMIHSRVATAAMRSGLAPPTTRDAASAASVDEPDNYGQVIVDLSTPGLDVIQTVNALRDRLGASTPIIAFAPHVHTSKLSAAREAGCDEVLSRGQFDREIDAVLQRLLSGREEHTRSDGQQQRP